MVFCYGSLSRLIHQSIQKLEYFIFAGLNQKKIFFCCLSSCQSHPFNSSAWHRPPRLSSPASPISLMSRCCWPSAVFLSLTHRRISTPTPTLLTHSLDSRIIKTETVMIGTGHHVLELLFVVCFQVGFAKFK